MSTKRTKLEGFLFWWLVACCTIFIVLFVLSAIFPASAIIGVSFVGPTLFAILFALLGMIGLLYFTWLMRDPSPRTLLIGIFLFFYSAIRIEWSDGLVGLTLGPPVRVTIVDNPWLLVQVDLTAFVMSALFAFAWHKRVSKPQVIESDNQEEIVVE